jgi:hypothetical protein
VYSDSKNEDSDVEEKKRLGTGAVMSRSCFLKTWAVFPTKLEWRAVWRAECRGKRLTSDLGRDQWQAECRMRIASKSAVIIKTELSKMKPRCNCDGLVS